MRKTGPEKYRANNKGVAGILRRKWDYAGLDFTNRK